MALSVEYKSLRKRVTTLRSVFVPNRTASMHSFSSRELDFARAYRLLAHAEIEHYFEKRALSIALKAFNLWISKSKTSFALQHITCNICGDAKGIVNNGSCIPVTEIIKKAYGQYRPLLKNNNGVRRINILTLLLPIGVREDDIDPSWLSTIDSFGIARGETAHTSGVVNTINPIDDCNTIKLIIDGIKDVDVILSRLERNTR